MANLKEMYPNFKPYNKCVYSFDGVIKKLEIISFPFDDEEGNVWINARELNKSMSMISYNITTLRIENDIKNDIKNDKTNNSNDTLPIPESDSMVAQSKICKTCNSSNNLEALVCTFCGTNLVSPDPVSPDPVSPFPFSPDPVSPGKSLFKTGATRSKDVDMYRFDLISPFALRALAAAHKEGEKYPMFNSEKGFPIYDLLNHVINHIYEYLAGDREENQLGKALWGLAMCIHSERMWPELNKDTLREKGCKPPANLDNKYWKDIH